EFALGIFGLVALNGDHVLFGRDRNIIRRETGHRQRYLVAVFGQPFDVVGRVIVLADALGHFREVEEAVEADGRTPQGREVVAAHSQILLRAKWLRAAPNTTGARLSPGPIRHPDATTG